MNTRSVNFTLHVVATGMVVGALGVLATTMFWKTPPGDDSGVEVVHRRPSDRSAVAATAPAQQQLQQVWNRRLRQPLAPTSPQDVDVVAAPGVGSPNTEGPAAAGAVALVGTIGDSIALIRDAAGAVEARSVGEMVNGVGTVIAVRPSEVDLNRDGHVITLRRAADAEARLVPLAPGSLPEVQDDPQLGMLNDGE